MLCIQERVIIRIGQFTDSYPPIINGVSALVNEHHHELLARGEPSFVFTFGRASDAVGEPQPGVYRSPGVQIGGWPFRFGRELDPEAKAVAETLEMFHVHEPFVIANVAMRMARRLNRPIVFTNHTRHDVYANNYPRLIQPPLKRYISLTLAKAIRMSDIATAPSEDSARWMRSLVPDLPPEHVRVMHNGIRLDAFADALNPHPRAMLGIPADRVLFMYIGRLTPEKNLPVFIEAFRLAVEAGANIHWLVIGDGSQRAELENLAAPLGDRVQFLGQVQRPDIPPYLALADVFATPSLSETNSLSVIEALSCSKPFLGLQSPWWDEFAVEHPAGLLTNHAPSALAEGIRQLADSPELRAKLGTYAKTISEQFDIKTVTTNWLALYHEMAELRLARKPLYI
jgi:glycosyltransferase involved in cell wall biosynthesis